MQLEVAMGQEQLLDVELDKHTVLKLPQHYAPINLKTFWFQKLQSHPITRAVSENITEEDRVDESLNIPES